MEGFRSALILQMKPLMADRKPIHSLGLCLSLEAEKSK